MAAAARIEQFVQEVERQMGWIAQSPWGAHGAAVDQRRLIDAEPLGELVLKGFLKPVPAFNLLGSRRRPQVGGWTTCGSLDWISEGGTLAFSGFEGPVANAFRQGLREGGYVEGQNLVIEYKPAQGRAGGFAAKAADLVRLKVELTYAVGPAALKAAATAGIADRYVTDY